MAGVERMYTDRLSRAEKAFVAIVFLLCAAGAALLPIDQCPDEAGRMLLTDWMVYRDGFPTGNEPETIMLGWGFSYALRPFLPSIVSSLFKATAVAFTDAPRILLFAARLTSVFSITICCVFLLRLGHRLFRRRDTSLLLAAFVCLLPQVAFLGMYQNNDAPSLAGVSGMLYFMVRGYDEEWSLVSCVGLGVCASAVLLTYYSAYGWVLAASLFLCSAVLTDQNLSEHKKFLLRRLLLVGGICILCAGGFFVRSALLHDGDFLGIASEARSRELMAQQGMELVAYNRPREQGLSFLEFLASKDFEVFWMTARSFVGVFGYMLIYLPPVQYGLYYSVILLGLGLCVVAVAGQGKDLARRDKLVFAATALASAITLALHLWASYARDYEPQGRYVITLALLLGLMLCYGVDNTSLHTKRGPFNFARALCCYWTILFALSYFGTMTQML